MELLKSEDVMYHLQPSALKNDKKIFSISGETDPK